MYRFITILLFALLLLTLTSATASAVSYSDEDNDGICEPGEEITFYGDPYFDYYDWDFNGDGLADDNGEVVTYVFDEEGIYIVNVIETNGHTEEISIVLVIKSEDQQEPNNDDSNKNEKLKEKIERILNRVNKNNIKINIIIKLLLKEYYKMERKGQNEFEFDIDQTLKDLEDQN